MVINLVSAGDKESTGAFQINEADVLCEPTSSYLTEIVVLRWTTDPNSWPWHTIIITRLFYNMVSNEVHSRRSIILR